MTSRPSQAVCHRRQSISNFNLLIITVGANAKLTNGLLFDSVHKNQNIVFAGGLVDPLSSYSFSIIKAMSVMCVSTGELGKINAVLSALESLFPLVAVQGYTSIWKVISKVSCFLDQNSFNSCKNLKKFKNVESGRKKSWFFVDVDFRDFKIRLFQKSEANFSEVLSFLILKFRQLN